MLFLVGVTIPTNKNYCRFIRLPAAKAMSRYDGEDAAWDGGPPGAESDPVPRLWASAAPPIKGIVQMAYSSCLQQTGPPNAPFGFARDDFLYTTSANVPGQLTQPSDKKETNSFPRSRRSPLHSHGRHDRNKSYTKHSKSRSRSPKRRFKKSRSRSLSKEKSSRSYNKPSHSINESKSYNSRKQRKISSSSSDSSDGSKSPGQPAPKESVYKHKEHVPARSEGRLKDYANEKMKSKKPSRYSRSPSPGSSSSKSSSQQERHYNHSKGGQSLTNTSLFLARRQKNSSPEPSGSDGFYKGQMKLDRPQNFIADYKNSRRGNFSGHSNHRPQSTDGHLNYSPVSHVHPVPPAATPFRNDGSFLEMFKKLQETQKAIVENASTTIAEVEKPELKKPAPPMVGKRRGGRVLKTGMVKKAKSIEEQTVDNTPTDAWSLYLKEVKKYKDSSCDEECKMRPLFK